MTIVGPERGDVMCKNFILCKFTKGSGILTFILMGAFRRKQLGDAFRPGGFDDSEVATYVRAMQERIGELQNLK